MNPMNALDACIRQANTNKTALARTMGRSKNYVSNFYVKGVSPSVETYVAMIRACGYELVARCSKTGDEIKIDE